MSIKRLSGKGVLQIGSSDLNADWLKYLAGGQYQEYDREAWEVATGFFNIRAEQRRQEWGLSPETEEGGRDSDE